MTKQELLNRRIENMDVCSLSSQFNVKKLTEADADAVFNLAAENPMFYKYCPPSVTKESIVEDMKALPPKKAYEDKYYIGFLDNEKLVAVMDLILNYPNNNTAFIGFFMMSAAYQGLGIGSSIISESIGYLRALGYAYIRLGFVKGNHQSEAFWYKNGFVETGTEIAQKNYTVVVMQKDCCAV